MKWFTSLSMEGHSVDIINAISCQYEILIQCYHTP